MNYEFARELIKGIVAARNFDNMTGITSAPVAGEYLIPALMMGYPEKEHGVYIYIGYVVQVRKKAGAYGSDMILMRHPDGSLVRHENNAFHRLNYFWLKMAKRIFPDGMTPDEYEDYSHPYTIGGNGEYPEIGKLIGANDNHPHDTSGPSVHVTHTDADGRKTVTAII